MLFSSELTAKILTGRKTQTRRLVKPGKDGAAPRCTYQPGRDYALERPMRLDEADPVLAAIIRGQRRGRPPRVEVARIRVTSVDRARVGDITFDQARAEGFPTPAAFKADWVRLHDRSWPKRAKSWCPDCLLNPDWEPNHTCPTCSGREEITLIPTVTEEQAAERFDQRWADTDVWVITFELVSAPLYLSADSASGDYVTSVFDPRGRRVAMTSQIVTEPAAGDQAAPPGTPSWSHGGVLTVPEEAVPPEIVDSWKSDPRSTHQRIKQRIRERGETAADQRALDRRLLNAEQRIRKAREAARLHGISVKSEARLVAYALRRKRSAQHIENLIRAVERKAYREDEETHAA